MIIYKNNCTEPYFNLACEQYLMDSQPTEPIFMLWRNDPSVIIGKNQNAYAELDLDFVRRHDIKVVRRLTGGGAVFHDPGNVNFTFIVPSTQQETIDFRRFTEPVISALHGLGVPAELSGRNDITVNGIKVSGNAACVYNGCTMHHGTLLFSADINGMAGALRPDSDKLASKGIESVRSRVANLSELIGRNMTAIDFIEYIRSCIASRYKAIETSLDVETIAKIQKLADEKYSSWEWNFGHSKELSLKRSHRYDFGKVEVNLKVVGGVICALELSGDYFGTRDSRLLADSVIGVKFDFDEIVKRFGEIDGGVGAYIMGADAKMLTALITSGGEI